MVSGLFNVPRVRAQSLYGVEAVKEGVSRPSRDISLLTQKDKIRMVMKEGEPWVDKISAQQRRVIQFEPGSWKIIDNA